MDLSLPLVPGTELFCVLDAQMKDELNDTEEAVENIRGRRKDDLQFGGSLKVSHSRWHCTRP